VTEAAVQQVAEVLMLRRGGGALMMTPWSGVVMEGVVGRIARED